ncbi:MAG TPA: methyltransferase domain-containing protein [Ktedonobacteraceae bacterium]|nr:methyltransferase domain-containing protein [Ktedonobacteraceae bacterium]
MPTPLDPRVNDNPSTYFVQDRKNKKELTRLKVQDQMITAVMGGALPEQPDPAVFGRVLDVGCGAGGWIIEAAQAKAHHVDDRVEFHTMDVLRTLDFPAASFDLVNLRFGVSFVRTWDWPKMLGELLRVTRPGGVIRVTEGEIGSQSNSPALTQLFEMEQCALFRSGHLFTQENTGLIDHLARLLDQYGCDQVQTKTYAIEYRAGTPEGEAFYENLMLLFQTVRPFIQKWGCVAKDYEAIYQQALQEMRQPDFLAIGTILTAWGSKPRPKSQQLHQ